MSLASPQWVLSEDYGVSLSGYNWVLIKAARNKNTGKLTGNWQQGGHHYFRTPEMLLLSLYEDIAREPSTNPDLIKHIEDALERSKRAAAAFAYHLKAIGAGLGSMPPKYASHQPTQESDNG